MNRYMILLIISSLLTSTLGLEVGEEFYSVSNGHQIEGNVLANELG
jgi:hypothetical protein